MPTDAEIEAAAKGIARLYTMGYGHFMAHAEAALIAAEKVRNGEEVRKHGYYDEQEARSEDCPDCGGPTRYFNAGPMGPSFGDKGEFLKVPYECECKAETGQPASNYSPQLARRDDQFFRQGVASERRRIVALIEGKREAHRAFGGEARNAIDDILAVVREDTDE